jgi:ligand-binding SRPBCC domain-containing protein
MKLYRLERSQHLPISVETAWDFFSNPKNLALITPPWLDFTVTSELPPRMFPGMILTCRIRPFWGFPCAWVSEITHVREPHFFVDEQRFGPYRFWHHQHLFEKMPDGVKIEDIVHYGLSCGVAGRILNHAVIGRRLNFIFDFRSQKLNAIFSDRKQNGPT